MLAAGLKIGQRGGLRSKEEGRLDWLISLGSGKWIAQERIMGE